MATNFDRRVFPRQPTKDIIAVILLPDNILSFCFFDISRSGLAFGYYAKRQKIKSNTKAFVTLLGEKIGALNIPVKIVSDTGIRKGKLFPSRTDINDRPLKWFRRCGVRFFNLSYDQELAICDYIKGLTSVNDIQGMNTL